jgi:hypothetical protein
MGLVVILNVLFCAFFEVNRPINIGFVAPNDGECCPSWEYEVAYKFQTNKLTLVSKKKVKQLQN